jgi:hypothetical protein
LTTLEVNPNLNTKTDSEMSRFFYLIEGEIVYF